MTRLRPVLKVALFATAAWLAARVTGPELVRSLRIKGWLPDGGAVERVSVTGKWHHPGPEGTYWVAWGDGNSPRAEDRLNVSPERWRALSPGDALEIVRDRDTSLPALRQSAVPPPRMIAAQASLLAIEIALALAAAPFLVRRLLRPRARRATGRDSVVLTVSPDFVFRPRVRPGDRLVFTEKAVDQ